jgi:8-oxo-dGTP pyrophosphatase MutT (NUDIX family)
MEMNINVRDITEEISTFTLKSRKGSVYIIFHDNDSVMVGKKKPYQYYHPIPSMPSRAPKAYKGKVHIVQYTTVEDQLYSIYPEGFPCNLNDDSDGSHLADDRRYYCFPGGKIENKENIAKAARREFLEETGIDLEDEKYASSCQFVLKEYQDGTAFFYTLVVTVSSEAGFHISAEVEEVNRRIQQTKTTFVDVITSAVDGYQSLNSKPVIPDDELEEVFCLNHSIGCQEYFVDTNTQGWYQSIFNNVFPPSK